MRLRKFSWVMQAIFMATLWVNTIWAAPATCKMCGKELNPKVAVEVRVEKRTDPYCCPHCAIMALSLLPDKERTHLNLYLTGYLSGEKIDSSEAYVVVDETKVVCCAPAIYAFAALGEAEAYAASNGGKAVLFKTAAGEMLKRKCGFCAMMVYPPTAIQVNVSGSRDVVYGCCPVCALGLVYQNAVAIRLSHVCEVCNKAIRLDITQDGGLSKASKALIFQETKLENGAAKPRGCHFNHLLCSQKCYDTWQSSHPDHTGNLLTIPEALKVAAKVYADRKK